MQLIHGEGLVQAMVVIGIFVLVILGAALVAGVMMFRRWRRKKKLA